MSSISRQEMSSGAPGQRDYPWRWFPYEAKQRALTDLGEPGTEVTTTCGFIAGYLSSAYRTSTYRTSTTYQTTTYPTTTHRNSTCRTSTGLRHHLAPPALPHQEIRPRPTARHSSEVTGRRECSEAVRAAPNKF